MTYNKRGNGLKGYAVVARGRHPITRKVRRLIRIVGTEAEARRLDPKLYRELMEKLHQDVSPHWDKALIQFFQHCEQEDYTANTLNSMRATLLAATKTWKGRCIDSITGADIRKIVKDDYGSKSQSTQRAVRKFINNVFNFALEKGYVQRNPTPHMKFRIGDKIKKVLVDEQVRHFLEHALRMESEWYYHWVLALYTGCRNGELYAMRWEKVDLDGRRILIDESWNSKDGFKDTKSGDDRIIEIAPNLVNILKELKIKQGNSPFVLPRLKAWDRGDQARELQKFLIGIGLPAIRFHDLRATWATIMLSKGVAPIKVMAMGGWKDLKTMQRYIRKAGVNVKGITDHLNLHDANKKGAKVLGFNRDGGRL